MLLLVPRKTAGHKPSPANTTLSRGWAQRGDFLVVCLSSEHYRLDVPHRVSFPPRLLSALDHIGSSGCLLRG